MKITDRIRSRFVKDFSLPFPIVLPEYFDYYLDLYDGLLKTRQKYSLLNEFDSEDQFFSENKELVDRVIEDVKSMEVYRKVSDHVFRLNTESLPEREIYTRDNVDKTFISIDMKQANFNCFLLISDVLEGKQEYVFRGKKSYKDYLHLFTPREYFKQSKYLRQVIFGNLNPKKQQQMQKYIMDYIVYVVRRKIDASKFFKSSADEIIIQSDSPEDKLEIKKCIDESFYNVKMFKLKQLGDKPYFVKEFDDSTIEFKCVPLHFFPQCYKYYHNLSITEKDRTFIFENNLAIFQESLFK